MTAEYHAAEHCPWGCGRKQGGECRNPECPRLANDPRQERRVLVPRKTPTAPVVKMTMPNNPMKRWSPFPPEAP